jgi:hypothetical protein
VTSVAAATKLTIDEDIRDILSRVQIDGAKVRVIDQLDPKTWKRCRRVLEALGGKYKTVSKAIVFHADAEPIIAEAIGTGTAVKRQTVLQAFFTKPELASVMHELAEVGPTDILLEPSAGKGALIRPILDGKVPLPKMTVMIDIDDHHHEVLSALSDPLSSFPMIALHGDFLSMSVQFQPTVVMMNPPFSNGQDILHIQKAYGMLAEHGRMVAIAGESAFSDRPATEPFRRWLHDAGAEVYSVPPDSFTGTKATARMIYVEKNPEADL